MRLRIVLASSLIFVPAFANAGGGTGGLEIGGAVAVAPAYEGASGYRVIPAPLIAPSFGGEREDSFVHFRGLDDIRFRVIRHGAFEAGPLAGWRFGRQEDDGARLAGLGDVDGGLIVGAYAAMKVGYLKPFLSYHHQVTGDDTSAIARFGSEAEFKLGHGIILTAVGGATYAGDDYMQQYFSVSAAQAVSSTAGLAPFSAGAGIKDVYLGLSGIIPISEKLTLRAGVKYSHLIADAADSPIVESVHQFSGSVGLSYRFTWGR